MQKEINVIQMQGNDDEELPMEEIQQLLAIPDIATALDKQMEAPQEKLMNISSAAYNGCPNDSTISLLLSIGKTSAIALADTCSTNTFMDLQFAKKNSIPMSATNYRGVQLAGGVLLSSTAIAHNYSFTVQGEKFTKKIRIVELQGSDVILGVN